MAERPTPIRPEESLAKMVAGLKEKTGKSLEEWRVVIAEAGLAKHGEVVSFLKAQHGLTHGYANQIALNRVEAAVPEGEVADPISTIFDKRLLARAIYDALLPQVLALGSDVDVAPKKANVSIRRKKQFLLCQPAADRLDVGIHLPGQAPDGRLEASGSFNAMVSHRVRVKSVEEVDEALLGWIRAAYERA